MKLKFGEQKKKSHTAKSGKNVGGSVTFSACKHLITMLAFKSLHTREAMTSLYIHYENVAPAFYNIILVEVTCDPFALWHIDLHD